MDTNEQEILDVTPEPKPGETVKITGTPVIQQVDPEVRKAREDREAKEKIASLFTSRLMNYAMYDGLEVQRHPDSVWYADPDREELAQSIETSAQTLGLSEDGVAKMKTMMWSVREAFHKGLLTLDDDDAERLCVDSMVKAIKEAQD